MSQKKLLFEIATIIGLSTIILWPWMALYGAQAYATSDILAKIHLGLLLVYPAGVLLFTSFANKMYNKYRFVSYVAMIIPSVFFYTDLTITITH